MSAAKQAKTRFYSEKVAQKQIVKSKRTVTRNLGLVKIKFKLLSFPFGK